MRLLACALAALFVPAQVLAAPPVHSARAARDVTRLPEGDVVPTLTTASDGRPVITLRQAVCVFADAEPSAAPFTAKSAEECARINRVTAVAREGGLVRLRVKAGKYHLQVMNTAAPWATGFELKGEHDPSLPRVNGEGIAPGTGKLFPIELTPGEYIYRCPVMQTPAYRLLVEG